MKIDQTKQKIEIALKKQMKNLFKKIFDFLGNFFDPPGDYHKYNNYPPVDWKRAPDYGEIPLITGQMPFDAPQITTTPPARPNEHRLVSSRPFNNHYIPPATGTTCGAFRPSRPKGYIASQLDNRNINDSVITAAAVTAAGAATIV